jgi:hypothetical protein
MDVQRLLTVVGSALGAVLDEDVGSRDWLS